MLGLIWIPSVRPRKKFFEKVNFEKNKQTTKKKITQHAKDYGAIGYFIPSCKHLNITATVCNRSKVMLFKFYLRYLEVVSLFLETKAGI